MFNATFLPDGATLPPLAWLVGVPMVCTGAQLLVWFIIARGGARRGSAGLQRLAIFTRWPGALLAALAGLAAALGVVDQADSRALASVVEHSATWLPALVIAAVTWGVVAAIAAGDEVLLSRFDTSVEDNFNARRMHTQVRVLARTLMFLVGMIGLAAAMVTFEPIRELGAGLLASAGLLGLAVGLAARPVLSNLIAGIQIALTQPITLDDAVVIDGEWGWIEEITLTYVVVKVWDQRRLIVPFSRIIEAPFQNWTRRTADLLGTVFVHADYTVDADAVRAELQRIVADTPLWDGRVALVQVTEAGERTVQLRALVSARNSPRLWDLRCIVRERLVAFLRDAHAHALPMERELRLNTAVHDGRPGMDTPRQGTERTASDETP